MVGFRSAGPSGALSELEKLKQQQYYGVDVPAYVAPPPPVTPPPDDNNDTNTSAIPGRPQTSSDAALDSVINKPQYDFDTNPETGNPEVIGMTQAQIENPVANPVDFYGNPIAPEVYSPVPDPSMMIPGGSIMSLNEPAIPTSGYGTPGTYSGISGGQFNQSSQAVDPITGQPIAEYGTTGAFMESLLDDPLANTTSPQGNLGDMDYAAQTSQLASLGAGTTDPTGNPATMGLDQDAKDIVAQQLGQDMGFESHTVAPGTATNQAIQTNSVVAGSQYSPTGTFTNQGDENNNDGGQGGTQSGGVGQSNSAANESYADDAAASDSGGGGGGGGGGCVIATHGVSTGAFTIMEKAKAELWCQKTYHNKWYGEAFRKGYRAVGMKHVNNGTAPSVYQEFKDFVAYGRGIKKGCRAAFNYYYRTITFFVIGLFIGE